MENSVWGVRVLARGYLNEPHLSSERFVENYDGSGERLYRSGDIGRWLADGRIEYLGRQDSQVKVRGYRIELGEIEQSILESGQVSQSVVLVQVDSQGHKRLVGYVVSEGDFDQSELIKYLHSCLPEYMVPQLWHQMAGFPLTSNGKLDRKAFPEVVGTTPSSTGYVAPSNELEDKLVQLWEELLG